jgi:hypothetical protein
VEKSPRKLVVKVPDREEITAAFEPYVAAVGRVVHAWNFLQEKLALIFAAMSGADHEIALAIWYSTENDRAQRQMFRAAINASPAKRWAATARDDLLWLLNRADELADAINNAIHVPCSAYTSDAGTEMAAAFHTGNPRARRLVGKHLIDEFLWCEEYAETLSRFAITTASALQDSRFEWPAKPGVPSRGRRRSLSGERKA